MAKAFDLSTLSASTHTAEGGAMNCHHRRADAAELRKRCTIHAKAAAVAQVMHFLARRAADTATGATLMHPDGTSTYISADAARAIYGAGKPEGRA